MNLVQEVIGIFLYEGGMFFNNTRYRSKLLEWLKVIYNSEKFNLVFWVRVSVLWGLMEIFQVWVNGYGSISEMVKVYGLWEGLFMGYVRIFRSWLIIVILLIMNMIVFCFFSWFFSIWVCFFFCLIICFISDVIWCVWWV